ncbi:MAG: alpha/beta hydrolase [Anaerolineales bacterium]
MKINLTHYPNLQLKGLLPRDAWVWLPPQYHQNPDARFPVIYMHDGQNLFYPEKSYTDETWGVAETMTKLSQWGFIRPAIVVGIDNTANRTGDYMPIEPFETPEGRVFIAKLKQDSKKEYKRFNWVADQYLQLMVEILKPRIDRDFRTQTRAEDTTVMGSSMGGLISLYALTQMPEVFGAAGCLSTHWPALGDFLIPYLIRRLPAAGKHKIYFDFGNQGLDASYPPYQKAVDVVMVNKGYKLGKNWLTHFAPGAEHHERAWRSRLHIALRFLLARD